MGDSAENEIKQRLEKLEESVKKSAESNQGQLTEIRDELKKTLLEYVKSNQDQLTLIRDTLDRHGGGGDRGAAGEAAAGEEDVLLLNGGLPDHIVEGDLEGYGPRFAPLSLAEWPYYHFDAEELDQVRDKPFIKESWPLQKIVSFYNEKFAPAKHFVANPVNNANKFLEHLQGRLGEAEGTIETERDFLFTKNQTIFKVLGYRVFSRSVITEITNMLSHKEFTLPNGVSDYLLLWEKTVLENDQIRALWADTVAYALLLNMDLKSTNYVDKRRYETNLNTYNALYADLVRQTASAHKKTLESLKRKNDTEGGGLFDGSVFRGQESVRGASQRDELLTGPTLR